MINTIEDLGHKVSAVADSVVHARDAKTSKLRVLATGTLLAGVFLFSTTQIALATDLGAYTKATATKTNAVLNIITYFCYIGGAILAALGVVDLKKHVEQPTQTPLKNGLAKLGFGGVLLGIPYITTVMQGTTGGDGAEATFKKFTTGPQL